MGAKGKPKMKTVVVLTSTRGAKLDDVFYGIYIAGSIGQVKARIRKELQEEGEVSWRDARDLVEYEFYFEEVEPVSLEGGEKQ